VTRIRKGDLLLNEQAKIEEMIEALRSRLRQIKEEHALMEQSLREIGEYALGPSKADLASIVARLQESNSRLKKELEYFRLSDTDMFELGKGSSTQPRPVHKRTPA
jgi:chromosome segregation ATPase